jgi:hypothetical protein
MLNLDAAGALYRQFLDLMAHRVTFQEQMRHAKKSHTELANLSASIVALMQELDIVEFTYQNFTLTILGDPPTLYTREAGQSILRLATPPGPLAPPEPLDLRAAS